MQSNLAVIPFRFQHMHNVSFLGTSKPDGNDKNNKILPPVLVETPKINDPVALPGVPFLLASKIIEAANSQHISIGAYLGASLKHLFYVPAVPAEESVSDTVGNTKVSTLIDGEQIFNKTVDFINDAKSSVLVEMFECQNLKVDGDIWPTNGAEVVPGFVQQQSLVPLLIKKKQENPNMKIQVILDAHKWYMDGNGNRVKHYNNQKMIKYLKENGIDVVPYPRAAQGGAALQHCKMLIVDGKKAIIGGMNWGTHSVANHDACVAIETLPDKKNSEVDNLVAQFNADWKLCWYAIRHTKMVAGPLNKEETHLYNGIRKEIKQENVDYMKIVGSLYDNPTDKTRYDKKDLSKLDMIVPNPVLNPQIKILGTKPNELSNVGEKGEESTRKYLMDKISTASKVRGELFVLSDKELVETIVKRTKSKELDAEFIISSEILDEFPYCRKAYNTLVSNGVPVRMYNFDERINQRLHSKWAVFNDEEVLIGSTNWSAMGLNQNLGKGKREDYELHSAKIDAEIKEFMKKTENFEKTLGIPPLINDAFDYKDVSTRYKAVAKAFETLKIDKTTTAEIDGKTYNFDKKQTKTLRTVAGYYDTIKKKYNANEKYKRGNNECAVAFTKPSLAAVFARQFDKDWKHSEIEPEGSKGRVLTMDSSEMQPFSVVG